MPRPAGVDGPADRVMALIKRVEGGDLTHLPALRKMLDETPAIWRGTGDLANQAVQAWTETAAGPNEVVRECIRRKLRELWRELAGDGAAPLERLLLDRVVCCWLAVHYAELRCARPPAEQTFKQAEFYEERLGRAQKRYLAAIRALTTYRRLLAPPAAVQVNVAEKQVNVAGGVSG